MATRITLEDLAANGIMVRPDGTAMKLAEREMPIESWTLTQLAGFIHHVEQAAIGFGRAEAVERYFQGYAVRLAHEKCKEEGTAWIKWCQQYQINRQTAWRSERLYVAAEQEWGSDAVKEVSQHTITELYLKFGILRKPEKTQDGDTPGVTQDDPDSESEEAVNIPFSGGGSNGQAVQKKPSSRNDADNGTETEESEGQETPDEASPKKYEFVFSKEAKASVTLREAGVFELQLQDDENGIVTLVMFREPTIDVICQQLKQKIEEDDGYDGDELPE